MIKIMLDVSKIDKARLYEGKKGVYLNAVLIETPKSEYGDFMIVEDRSYEERQAGQKGTILGNGKIVTGHGSDQREDPPEGNYDKGDVPF